ncbi:PREDICTED: two-component response regulator ARR22-like [Populus euphratica]|uniref:Two-component response regulator ARR22-like n=1 Tax=Populus euphratica TaxID=75702 RepID=A0AAJ6X3Z0_POPEU|nr:PREDICTED: two-component response regulator ARR22-like [Populus euphratica]
MACSAAIGDQLQLVLALNKRNEMATSNGRTKITALVVDDDRIIKTIHSKLLSKLGIENHVAANGKEAVDLHCSGKKFDLIVMDREMPIMNGIEATRELRALGIRSIIVGVSTRSLGQEIQEFMDAGLDYYQEKPLTSSKVISILHQINHNS